uniref:two-partner secretion domain-containing protein n=1 Tax=Selenomonas ruminantium TaxID=971 RepID=UPI0026F0F47C
MKRNCQQKLKYTSLAAMIAFTLSTGLVYGADMPVDGKVVAGKVTIDGTEYVPAVGDNPAVNPLTGETLVVTGNSVIDWTTFDIGSDKSLTFVGQGNNYILNQVPWNNPASKIYGILNTQNIYFILANPNGITVGNGAQLNAIDGGSILLAAMRNTSNDSITLYNRDYGTSTINIKGDVAVNGDVTLMAKTINVADGITFSGDTALKLLAGETLYNQPITVTTGGSVDSIGNYGSITFSGSLIDNSNRVTLGVATGTITMLAGKEIALTRADSAVNINTSSLQNADITAPVVTLVRDGAITVSDSKLKSTVGDIKVLSGTLLEDGKTLSNTTVTNNNYIVNHKVTMNNSSVISANDAIIAAAAVDISGKKAGESAAIAAVNDVFIASGTNVPLQSGSLTTDSGMNTSVTVSNAEIQGRNLTLAGNDVTVTSSSELTATNDMQIVAAPNMTVSNGKVVSGQNSTTSNGGVLITDSVLQGKNISLTGIAVNANGTIGDASTETV